MPRLLVLANEATAAQRRVYFHLVDATDGITAETGEAGGQPQVSSDGAAWTNTGIGTLTAIGNGRYYADLTQTLVQTAGTLIETRYKSANTAECPGDSVQVVAFDPNDTVRLGLTALPNAAADAAGGLPISDAGGLDLDAKLANTNEVTAARMGALTDWIDGGRLDLILDARASQASLDTLDNIIDTEFPALVIVADAIKAKTDSLTFTVANVLDANALRVGGTVQTAGDLAALIVTVDTVVDAILVDTNELQTDWVNGGRLDIILDAAKDNTDYPDDFVHVSTAGSAGTTVGVNGTARNPVSNVNDARTIAIQLGLNLKGGPGESFTVSTGSLANYRIDLNSGAWTIDNAVSLSGTRLYSSGQRANLYGPALGPVDVETSTVLQNLYVTGIILNTPGLVMIDCGLGGNVTDSTGGPNASFRPILTDCYNFKSDGSDVTFALASGGHWLLEGWYGNLTITGMAAGQTFRVFGYGKLTIAASCTGGTIQHTSHVEITDLASGAVTTDLISEAGTVSGFTTAAKAELQQEAADAINSYDGLVPADLPANFAAMAITVGGAVTAGTVSDKTGYALSATGMNLVVPADPSTIPVLGTASIVTWIGWFGAWTVNEVNVTATSAKLRNSADNADMASHTISDDGTTFSSQEPT